MTSISNVTSQVLSARNQAQQQQIDVALIRKGLDVQKQSGDAINELLEQSLTVQRQIADGRIDVRV